MNALFNNPKAIVEAGERIYQEKFKNDLESNRKGQYAVINVLKETAVTAATPELAFEKARKADPNGVFHLIRVGYSGAYQVSYQFGRNGRKDWLFG